MLPHAEFPLWLRVSEHGSGVGLTALRDPGSSAHLVIHVLPKFWLMPDHRPVVLAPLHGGTIQVFEGDVVGFKGPWRELASRSLIARADSSDRDHPVGTADLEEDLALHPLWSQSVPPQRAAAPASPADIGTVHRLWELLLARGLPPQPVPQTVLPALTGREVLSHRPELELLVKATFLELATELIPRRKPTYVEHRERLGTVRGRLVASALAMRAATGEAHITCDFDEQSRDHLVWKVINTALQLCAGRTAVQQSALACLRQLFDVGVLDTVDALLRSSGLAGSVRDPDVSRLLGLARQILGAEFGLASEIGSGQAVLANIKFSTSALWEKLLVRAFEEAGCQVQEQAQLDLLFRHGAGEWKAATSKRPDLVVTSPVAGTFIVDAKYMHPLKFNQSSKSDQYQAVAYAMRTGLPTLLAYAATPGGAEQHGPSEFSFLAVAPRNRSLQLDRVRAIDSTWTLVGSVACPFPSAGPGTTLERAEGLLATSAQAVIQAIPQHTRV